MADTNVIEEKQGLFGPNTGYPDNYASVSGSSHSYSVNAQRDREMDDRELSVSLEHQPSFDRNSSAVSAGWNVATMVQGTGALGVPFAFMYTGYYGVAIMVFIAVFSFYTGVILVDCMYQDSRSNLGFRKRVRVSYPDIGHAVWPKFGRGLISLTLFINMAGNSVMYIILLAASSYHLLKNHVPLTIAEWSLIWCGLCFPTAFLKRMSIIAWISCLAIISLLISMTMVLVYCIMHHKEWNYNNLDVPFDFQKFTIAFGIIVFTYNGQSIFPGVEASMVKPGHYNKMLAASYIISTITKLVLGIIPVCLFGSKTLQTVTNNVVDVPLIGPVVIVTVIICAFLTFPLNQFVMNGAVDEAILMQFFQFYARGMKYHWVYLLLTRAVLVIGVLFCVIIVPQFGLVIGFTGSLVGSALSFIFPCFFHLKLKYKYLRWYHVLTDVFLIFVGVASGVAGVYSSGKALVEASRI